MTRQTYPTISISRVNKINDPSISSSLFTIVKADKEATKLFDFPFRFQGGAFSVCTQGSGHISVNLTDHDIMANQMLVIAPDSIIRLHDLSDDFNAIIIGFSTELFKGVNIQTYIPIYADILEHPTFPLNKNDMEVVLELCDFMDKKAKRTEHPYRDEITQNLMLALFYETCSIYQRERPYSVKRISRGEEIAIRLRELISQHYIKERSVEFYAQELCLTPKYLSTTIKKTTGKSVPEWIRMALVLDAKIQLKSSFDTVQQISDRLNFPNPSFFGRFFKKYTGMTPLEYRQQ